jgi:hypothetical protein
MTTGTDGLHPNVTFVVEAHARLEEDRKIAEFWRYYADLDQANAFFAAKP